GFSHTYVGASLVAVISILIGRPICQFLLNWWIPTPESTFEKWLRGPKNISWVAAISGAFLGTFSHVFLDSMMHFDLRPWIPWSQQNSLLGIISIESLHLLCIFSGFLGVIILVFCYRRSRINKLKYE
ncbi:MAG TPA: DUF4184 family protein, partial [Acidobacteriota bacterium]